MRKFQVIVIRNQHMDLKMKVSGLLMTAELYTVIL